MEETLLLTSNHLIQIRIGSRILLAQPASGHIEWSSRTVPQERSPIPQLLREVLPAGEDQEAEDGGGEGAGMSTSTSGERWHDDDVQDITPPQPTFRPTRSPGPQLICTATYTVLQLFQLFFTNSILQTIIQNVNDFGSTHYSTPTNPWIDVTLQDMFSFMSMVLYMGVIKCCAFRDYWRQSKLYSLPFPRRVITDKKFLSISWALHLSSLVADAERAEERHSSLRSILQNQTTVRGDEGSL
ncbi:uncharacterized protein LOC117769069 [Hippoglossus hippoglossus]|uniref:uncharacterized protein LOC117769069 n=1 Tax=Hippoglossus hippoglossus TaxID=8267 RepID=UPI00148DEF7D|nr:uncharacterized protein LOC117769069 [Hippoglossus hippoglossus]